MFDLPPHLQALNALPSAHSPPSSALNPEQEEAFWAFLNTDELFSSFGVPAAAFEDKKGAAAAAASAETAAATPATPPDAPAPTPVAAAERKPAQPTLEAFLATFANETPAASSSSASASSSSAAALSSLGSMAMANSYLLPLPLPYASPADAAAAPTPLGVNTADVMPFAAGSSAAPESPADERALGAKRLKQLGAPPAEIEEDKRRRNTEASARFRAKKKEREQALEQRAKELERQVAALVAEKASLEKENSLLKFIVVNGSSGGGGGAATAGAEGLQAALAALGKRKRDE